MIKHVFNIRTLVLFLFTGFIMACQAPDKYATTVVKNAVIWTGDSSTLYAECMAIGADTIMAVGSFDNIQRYIGSETQVIDMNGRFITPGFIDAHAHLLLGGLQLLSIQLDDCATQQQFIDKIKSFAAGLPEGKWIVGAGWDHNKWGGELPTHQWIDSVTQHHPVFIHRYDGHTVLANKVAMELAGLDSLATDVENPNILWDKNGRPNGIFKEEAMAMIERAIPPPSTEEIDHALDTAMKVYVSHGITSMHNMWAHSAVSDQSLEIFEKAKKEQRLLLRIYDLGQLNAGPIRAEIVEKKGSGDYWVKYNGLKGFLDGSLGSHNAAMHEPFIDGSDEMGDVMYTDDELYKLVTDASDAHLQITLHAIGDRANGMLLSTYQKAQQAMGHMDQRFRIEHAQHVAAADIPQFGSSNIIPTMQPYSVIDDGVWAGKYVNDSLLRTSYAFHSLLQSGAKLCFSSDWPVYTPSVMQGIYAAVTRSTVDGQNPDGWYPEQKISVEEALKAYTQHGAYASFEENIKGTLAPGKFADFVVLSENILTIDPVQIREAKVLQTYVGGKKVFDCEGE